MPDHGSATRRRHFTVATLDDLRRLPPPRVVPAQVEVDIRLDGIEGAHRAELERRMARELAACGCREGSIAVLLYAGIVLLLAVLGPFAPDTAFGWVAIVAGVLAASMLGKVLGLALAQVRLMRVAREVEATLREGAVF
jgi:hypothetical protein